MIREHEFNSAWWGAPVGIVDDPDFFGAGDDEIEDRLGAYEWVEFRMALDSDPPISRLRRFGFFHVDIQLPFLLNLRAVSRSVSTDSLQAVSAVAEPFRVSTGETEPFTHERFRFVPGCDEERIDERYATWASGMAVKYPETCLQLKLDGKRQGWFLAHPDEAGRLNLSLAMLARDATISGMLLYQAACLEYARMGYRLGTARFSVTNTAVHNMYSALKARFLTPEGCWLWTGETTGK